MKVRENKCHKYEYCDCWSMRTAQKNGQNSPS